MTRPTFKVLKVYIIFKLKLLTQKPKIWHKTPFTTFLIKVRQTFQHLFAYDFRLPLKKDLFTWWMQGMMGKVFGHCQRTPKGLTVYLYHHSVLVFWSQAKLYIPSTINISHLGRQQMGWFLADIACTSSKTDVLNKIGI